MKIQDPDHKSPTKADVFVETRKRKEGREYKSSIDVLQFRLSKIKEVQLAGGKADLIEPLISGEKTHAPSWLIERQVNAKKMKRNSKQIVLNQDEDYINDLTAKIRGQLEAEMEDKVIQKVQQNLASMLTSWEKLILTSRSILKMFSQDALAQAATNAMNRLRTCRLPIQSCLMNFRLVFRI